MEKILGAHNAVGTNQHSEKEVRAKILPEPLYEDTAIRTRERLGEEYKISHATVFYYGKYSRALDELTQIVPDLVPKILSGEFKISRANVVELAQLPGQTIKRLCQQLADDEAEFVGSLREFIPSKHRLSGRQPIGSVKEMPAYDPDAEISALALTVPSWVSSIKRAHSASNLAGTTGDARCRLEKELLGLKETIDSMLTAMKEVT